MCARHGDMGASQMPCAVVMWYLPAALYFYVHVLMVTTVWCDVCIDVPALLLQDLAELLYETSLITSGFQVGCCEGWLASLLCRGSGTLLTTLPLLSFPTFCLAAAETLALITCFCPCRWTFPRRMQTRCSSLCQWSWAAATPPTAAATPAAVGAAAAAVNQSLQHSQ